MRFLTKTSEDFQADTVICFIYENQQSQSKLFKKLNELSKNELKKQIFEYKSIKGSVFETFKYSVSKDKKVLVCGLGKKEDLTRMTFSQIIASAARAAKTIAQNSIAIELIDNVKTDNNILSSFNMEDSAKITLSALRIGLYEFSKYTNKNKEIETVELICDKITPEIEKGAQIGAYTSFAMKYAKDTE